MTTMPEPPLPPAVNPGLPCPPPPPLPVFYRALVASPELYPPLPPPENGAFGFVE